jgi:ribosomal protein S18 acetylase RimI-like enzyme
MNLNIRPMATRDKSPLMRILKDTPEFTPMEVVVAEEVIDSYLKDALRSGYHVLIAEVDRVIVGYICYGPTPLTEGTWDLYWATVSQDMRSKGIGSALWNSAEDEIKKAHGRLAIIETSSKPSYEKTRHFHQTQGYELVSRVPDFYAPKDDKLIYAKRLG